ncbi:MAG: hypothetical protein GXN99_02015, partial [Candidatus Nanohaloarchaeota archaeon]|nr:hypothetical protein [Candidatus Nanohaloarchaeota archaeon]
SKTACILTEYNPSRCLPFLPRNYYIADITEPIQMALADGKTYLTLTLNESPERRFISQARSTYIPGFIYADNITLKPHYHIDVTCNKSLPNADDVDSSVVLDTVYSKDGDTLLVWNDTFYVFDHNDVNGSEYLKGSHPRKVYNPREIRYRIYKSTQPITSQNIVNAELVAEVSPLSGWLPTFYGGIMYPTVIKKRFKSWIIPRHPIYDEVISNYNQYVYAIPNTEEGDYYYAVVKVIDGQEDYSDVQLGKNSLSHPIHEKPGTGLVLLYNHSFEKGALYVKGPIERWYYVKWAFPERNESNKPRPDFYVVRISRNPKHKSITGEKRPLHIGLHCWNGWFNYGYMWWYNAERGSILLATNQYPYDWWTAYHENYGTLKSYFQGKVYNYTQIRIWNFVKNFMDKHYNIDYNYVSLGGNSMGGSGTVMWGLRHPEMFAFIVGNVGVYDPALSPQFKGSFEGVYGKVGWNITYDHTNMSAFEYWNTTRYIYDNPSKSMPWAVFANGRNDNAIGWAQAWYTVKALHDTKQPFVFKWGMHGHGERMAFPCGGDRYPTIILLKNQSLPAFTNGSLDTPLNKTPETAPNKGKINYYYMWDPKSIVDEPDRWEVTIYLCDKASVDEADVWITPRRLQNFKVLPHQTYYWRNVQNGKVIQEGVVKPDKWGLITLPNVTISKSKNRIMISQNGFDLVLSAPSQPITWITNREHSYTLKAYGGVPPYTFYIKEGSLPAGVVLDPNTGTLHGKTNQVGSYPITLAVRDQQNQESEISIIIVVMPSKMNFTIPIPIYNNTIIVGPENASKLPYIVENAPPYTTIYLKDGTYYIGYNVLNFRKPNITFISLSRNPSKVILDGRWVTNEYINLYAENITIAYLTIKHVNYHPIHLKGGANYAKLIGLHLLDSGEMLIKVNPSQGDWDAPNTKFNDYGILAHSVMEYTDEGRKHIKDALGGGSCYTDGFDALAIQGWRIFNNTFKRIYCEDGRRITQAFLCWRGCKDVIVENNLFINNPVGIQMCLGEYRESNIRSFDNKTKYPCIGGIVRNNIVYNDGSKRLDTGIGLWRANQTKVYGNVVIAPDENVYASIHARYGDTQVYVVNNLLTHRILATDGARIIKNTPNIQNAPLSWFTGLPYELNLTFDAVPEVADKGMYLGSDLLYDYYGNARDILPDIGAVEYQGKKDININRNLMVSCSPLKGEPPLTITLHISHYCDDCKIKVDFDGDGHYDLTTSQKQVTHTYTEPGVYTIKVGLFWQNTLLNEISSIKIRVIEKKVEKQKEKKKKKTGGGGGFTVPTKQENKSKPSFKQNETNDIKFTLKANPDEGEVPLTVKFELISKRNPLKNLLSTYEWDFDGDGTIDRTTHSPQTIYTYEETGLYNAKLSFKYGDKTYTFQTLIKALPSISQPSESKEPTPMKVVKTAIIEEESEDTNNSLEEILSNTSESSLLKQLSSAVSFAKSETYTYLSKHSNDPYMWGFIIVSFLIILGILYYIIKRNSTHFPLNLKKIVLYKYYNKDQEIYDIDIDKVNAYLNALKTYKEYVKYIPLLDLDTLLHASKYLKLYLSDGKEAYVILSNEKSPLYDDAIIIKDKKGNEQWWIGK